MIGQDGLQYAGAFKLSECKLITHTGPEVDLTQVITEVNIYEELQSHSLSADITFFDDKDAVSFYPIVGNEYVRLKIGTPDRTGDGQINFTKHTFVVYKISQKIDAQQGSFVSLKLTTQEIFNNVRRRVSQSYRGNFHEIVEKIFRDKNYLDSKKDFITEEDTGGGAVLIPNMHPFDAIDMISQKAATDKNSSSFLFFETTRGYKFLSLEKLFSIGSVFSLNVGQGADFQKKNVNPQEQNLNLVEENKMISNNDILNSTKTGLYASKLIIHDIHNKSYSVKTFSYKNEFNKNVDVENLSGGKGHPLFPLDSILNEDENKISDFNDALLTVQSTDRTSFISPNTVYPNYNKPISKVNPEENTLNRFHKFSMLNNGLAHFLEIVGNTALEVGDIVTLSFPKNQKNSGEFRDEKLSGNYLITKLRHFFSFAGDAKHRIGMEVVKDSVGQGYPNGLPVTPKGTGKTRFV